jgi:hypoxanthine phosphoribosyltransferase
MSDSRTPYDYTRRDGVRAISWNDFHGICKALALVVSAFDPEAIVAVARGGLYPGTLLSHLLRRELHPVRLTRRVDDVVVHETPVWIVEPSTLLKGKRVLVVDEIVSTGETIAIVAGRVRDLGAAEVRTAVMYAHSWGLDRADYVGLVSDALLLNPWDREALTADGRFDWHPEYRGAFEQQGLVPDDSLRIDTPQFRLAKSR